METTTTTGESQKPSSSTDDNAKPAASEATITKKEAPSTNSMASPAAAPNTNTVASPNTAGGAQTSAYPASTVATASPAPTVTSSNAAASAVAASDGNGELTEASNNNDNNVDTHATTSTTAERSSNNNNSSSQSNVTPQPLAAVASAVASSSPPPRPSSLSSKNRYSGVLSQQGGVGNAVSKHHAYFASSEEESEAELGDEQDSHSSAFKYYYQPSKPIHHHSTSSQTAPGSINNPVTSSSSGVTKSKSAVRLNSSKKFRSVGSKKLTEIASKVSNNSKKMVHMAEGDGLRVRVHMADSEKKKLTSILSKQKMNPNANDNLSLTHEPPQTVTVAKTPKDSTTQVNFDPSAGSSSEKPRRRRRRKHKHLPSGLPVLKDPRSCMWTSTHDANAPSEDRYSSLVNVLLRPPKSSDKGMSSSEVSSDGEEETHPTVNDDDNTSLIRLSLWSVIDGHGGGCVATYAAEVLLPHIAASVARALNSEIVDRGVCNVNGQLRDANALDLDGLIRSSDRSRSVGKSQVRQREAGIDVVNPNSIHYRSPYEDSESEGDVGVDHNSRGTTAGSMSGSMLRSESESEAESEAPVSVASSLLPGNPIMSHGESVSSVKTSVKTAVSPVTQHAPVGTHSPAEVAAITRAITDSFLAVDEGWINSIDPVMTHQTSCVSNGRWNAGACALVVFIVQRLDWCRSSRVDHEAHHRDRGSRGFDDTSHNKDAARRRKLDYAAKSKSVSSLSTLSSTSSITTEANTTENLGEESEITETEDDDDVSDIFGPRRRRRKNIGSIDPHHTEGVFIPTPAGCKCHYYRPHDAMLYTAHVGDCRAVMLGSAPPRTIKVPPEGDHSLRHADTSEDESRTSVSIADEISSSDHDSDSSEEGCEDDEHFNMRRATPPSSAAAAGNAAYMGYVRRASKRQRRGENKSMIEQPFVPLPPIERHEASSSEESVVESDASEITTTHQHQPPVNAIRSRGYRAVDLPFKDEEPEDEIKEEIRSVRSGSPTQMDRPPSPTQLVADPPDHPPPMPLSMLMRPIDLTTDHSAYNPAEVTAVLRRCNNAPKAISSASGGGIKRVAGSLAVTRALGDAYLKTPRLSFFPYKRHAPYITARPEVNCRIITKGADRILILASDGVWERASGDDVLRWVRNYYNARIAGVKESTFHPLYDMGIGEAEDHPFGETRDRGESEAEDHPFGETRDRSERISRRKASSGSEGGSLVKTEGLEKESALLASPGEDDTSTTTATPPTVSTGATEDTSSHDDGATTSAMATASTTSSADETAKVGSKRKHSEGGSVSTRSSNESLALDMHVTRPSRRHNSRSYSPGIPTVSEVIVRKVLNKVRKTRNISSLRMLMSLPKGRARRSKHDDITASVVDLSGFVS